MRLYLVLFAMSLGMLGVLLATYFIDEQPAAVVVGDDGTSSVVPQGHGVGNSAHATMLAGGDGAARYENVWVLALLFGLFQIGFFVVALAAGGSKHGQLGPLKLPLIIGTAVYAVAFAAMILTHRTYAAATDPPLFLGWPIPTAWMMYGVWLAPLVFMFLFLFKFDSWVYTDEDRRKFDEILAQQGPGKTES